MKPKYNRQFKINQSMYNVYVYKQNKNEFQQKYKLIKQRKQAHKTTRHHAG